MCVFRTASDGILTSDVVPPQYIISVDDTAKKVNLYRRQQEVAQSATSSGGEVGVQQLVETFEAKASQQAGSKSPAASTGAPTATAFFPGKVKPPPPNVAQLAGMPGYASSRLLPPPPKGEAPKPPAAKVESPKTPPKVPPKPSPKEGTSAPHAPEVPKAVTSEVDASAKEEPAKKKAALTSVPAAVPAASSAAAFLEPVSKVAPPKAVQKDPKAPVAGSPSKTPASTSKSLVPKQKSRPKGDDQPSKKEEKKEDKKPVPIKIEVTQCSRCFAQTFKGQIECDVCGLMLEGVNKADRTKIAERRKAALHKLGLYYDFRGEYLQSITHSQLESLGLLDDQARGSSSPEASLLARAKSRFDRALSLGYVSVADRFAQDATFAESVLNEGENEYDCERYDLLKSAHLPKPGRTKAQVKMGVSEQSQLEHNAMRLVYLDLASRLDVPKSFRYIDQPWFYMYRTEIYSEEEYIDYLNRNPQHNLLLSCTGVDNIAVHDAERHLRWIKGQNEELYKQNAAEKKKQSDRAREQNEAKRKAEQTGAYGQGPSKKGTVKPVARTSTVEVASSSTSASQWINRPQQSQSHDDRRYTGEWQKWHGRWYEKVIRHGRVEWEEG